MFYNVRQDVPFFGKDVEGEGAMAAPAHAREPFLPSPFALPVGAPLSRAADGATLAVRQGRWLDGAGGHWTR